MKLYKKYREITKFNKNRAKFAKFFKVGQSLLRIM